MNNYVTANFQSLITKAQTVCSTNTGGGDGSDDEEEEDGDGDGDGCTGYEITFSLTFDDYPEETRWIVKNIGTGAKVAEGKNYDESYIGETIDETICLPDGCYKLVVRDSYGDGICCSYGEGTFSILDEDGYEFYYSDGNFGNKERVDFCIDLGEYKQGGNEKDTKSTNLLPKSQRTVDK